MVVETVDRARHQESHRLPWFGLLALFSAGFLSIINETVPAGLLPRIADTLGISEAAAGQTVTIYALATALSAIPLGVLLARWGRRTVLVSALGAFVVANLVISGTNDFTIILVARFIAGVGSGLIWTNLAAYAARLAPEGQQGRAMAIANAGTPVALSIGLPLGTVLGDALGWHATFAVTAYVGIAVIIWTLLALPNLPGVVREKRVKLGTILRARGVPTVLVVMSGFFLAHNILYTYVAPLAEVAGEGSRIQWLLFVFGFAAFVSIWITGMLIDRRHRLLTISGMFLVGIAALLLTLVTAHPAFLYVAALVWGLGFGGGATWFITAGFRASGGDEIAATLVTLVNLMIGAGGLVGGLLLGATVLSLPWAALVIMVPTAVLVVAARRHAFPHWSD